MEPREHFERFVAANSDGLFATARMLTGSSAAAEELLQATLAHLYPRWTMVMAADSDVAYVRRAVVNRHVSEQRTRRRQRQQPQPYPVDDPIEHVIDRLTVDQLLAALPARQRVAIVLRFLDDLDDAAIADQLGCRASTVRTLVSRGLRRLRTAPVSSAERPARRISSPGR